MRSIAVDPRRRPVHAALHRLAQDQGGVISRSQAYAAGLTRGELRAAVRARRWRRVGRHAVALHTGPLARSGRWWAATFEGGPRAVLDGVSALEAAGLEGWVPEPVRVSVPRGARVRRAPGLNVRQTRRLTEDDRAQGSLPRTRPEVAAVRACLWARSDKQAALVLTMAVQQGLTTPDRLALEAVRVLRDRRRRLLHAVVLDLLEGSRSLGEAEFARECRARGLPEPSRQVLHRGRDGRCWTDVEWRRWGVVVEVDGVHHTAGVAVVHDALRQNRLAIEGAVVLRLPLLGLRVAPDDFFAQIAEALAARGCPDVMRRGRPGDRTA